MFSDLWLGVVVHVFNTSSREAEADPSLNSRSLWFTKWAPVSQNYTVTLSLRKNLSDLWSTRHILRSGLGDPGALPRNLERHTGVWGKSTGTYKEVSTEFRPTCDLRKAECCWAVVECFNPQQRQAISEFKASLVYIWSSRVVRTTDRDPVLKNK